MYEETFIKTDKAFAQVADMCTVMCMDMCIDWCVNMCIDGCMDMCIDRCTVTCTDMSLDICMDMSIDIRMVMCIDMCMDLCVNVCMDVHRHVHRRVYRHRQVYRQARLAWQVAALQALQQEWTAESASQVCLPASQPSLAIPLDHGPTISSGPSGSWSCLRARARGHGYCMDAFTNMCLECG